MKTIYKYPLQIMDGQTITMPKGAEILTAHDTTQYQDRVIEVFGTGNPIWTDMAVSRKYIATAQQGPFVWHVFESTL